MLRRELLLRWHEGFQVTRTAELCREAQTKAGAHVVDPESLPSDIASCANRYDLPAGGELWFTEVRAPVTFCIPDGDFIRVQIQHAGAGLTVFDGESINVNENQSCISPARATLRHGAGFEQLVWRVPHDLLVRKFVALSGAPIARKLTFDPVFKRDTAQSNAFASVLNCVLSVIDHTVDTPPSLVLAELEDAMMVSLLVNCRHSLSDLLERKVPIAAPWQVRRVEEYIEAHWDDAFDIEEIANATGISARSIYRSFQRSRGYSPKEFARRRRLQQARALLEEDQGENTVTSVAFVCGFNDVGYFSREFSKAFGEAPSAVLARRDRSAMRVKRGRSCLV